MKAIVDKIKIWTWGIAMCPVRKTAMWHGPESQKFGEDISDVKTIWYDKKIREQLFKYFADYQGEEINSGFRPQYKIINQDTVNDDDINLVVIPGDDTRTLAEIPGLLLQRKDLIEFVNNNNVKIVVAWIFEHISLHPAYYMGDNVQMRKFFLQFDKLIEQLPPSKFQWLLNSYDKDHKFTLWHDKYDHPIGIHADKYKPYVTHIDCFDKISQFEYLNWDPYADHTYKLSVPVGMIDGRWLRLDLIAELIERNILWQKDVIHTQNVPDPEEAIKKYLGSNPDPVLKQATRDTVDRVGPENVFQHRIISNKGYDINLLRLKVATEVATGTFWYRTPPQFIDSQFQVVIESRIHLPSITEKVYRPLMLGQPFLWIAAPDLKPYLESKGYQFYPWIDYSFDAEHNQLYRFNMVMDEVERLYHTDLSQYLIDTDEINIHNIKAFRYNERDTSDMEEFLNDL